MNIYLCPSPELYPLYHRPGCCVIVVDIFRASTTMVTALAHRARSIIPVASTEEAERLGQSTDCLVAAERDTRRCAFAQLGNDPAEYSYEAVNGHDIVFTTTNGTRSITIAQQHGVEELLVGAFINLSSTLEHCAAAGRDILILAAGWRGQASMEDMLYAGALADRAEKLGLGQAADDATRMMCDLWRAHCLSLGERVRYLRESEHYRRLVASGFADSVPYCLSLDLHPLVARMEGDRLLALNEHPAYT